MKYPEFSVSNDKYGLNKIVRDYTGWPDNKALPCIIPHAITSAVFDYPRSPLKTIWLYNEYEENRLQKYCPPEWRAIFGFPIIYLPLPEENNPTGTLAFPAHGYANSKYTRTETDFRKYLIGLKHLPDKYHPITVSVHPGELHFTPIVEEYDFKVLRNADNILQTGFLPTLMQNITNHTYVTSDYSGLHMWLAVYLNRPMFYYGAAEFNGARRGVMYENVFPYPHVVTNQQKVMARGFLGLNYYKSPDEIRTRLEEWAKTSYTYIKLQRLVDKHGPKVCRLFS